MCMQRFFFTAAICLLSFALQGCKHPLAIRGKGDIVDLNRTGYGCTLKQYKADKIACIQSVDGGGYHVNYKAKPYPGWRFLRWEGPCAPDSNFQNCRLDVSEAEIARWD